MYDTDRYVTVTGQHLDKYPREIHERTDQLAALHAEVFPPSESPKNSTPTGHINLDDDDLLRRIRASAQGPKFERLWTGDTGEYSSASEADLALCCILAFWTDRDPARIERLVWQSGLYREKWERQDYIARTIARAIEVTTETYQPPDGASFNANGTAPDDSESDASAEWESPEPLKEVAELPLFPTYVLPSPIRKMVEEVADAYQVPVDLPAMQTLAVLSTTAARRIEVEIWPGWKEPVNLYTAVVLPPAERKTAVNRTIIAPLERHERTRIAAMRDEIAEANAEHELLEAEYRAAVTRAAKANGDDQLAAEGDARALAVKLAKHHVPSVPRLLADDVTPEKLVSLMDEQDGRIGLLSAEGGVFEMMSGRYSKSGVLNLDVYLKAHAGDAIRIDRRTREAEYISSPALTLGLAVQPIVLDGLLANPAFRGRGVVARFAYSVPRPMVGRRKVRTRAVQPAVIEGYEAVINDLLKLEPAKDDDGSAAPNLLEMTPEASSAIEQFSQGLEPRLSEFGDLGHMADWAGKVSGTAARIAALLHLAEHHRKHAPWTTPLESHTVAAAVKIAEYLIEHAKAVYSRMGADPDLAAADRVLRWLLERGNSVYSENSEYGLVVTKRDIHQPLRRTFPKPNDLDKPLQILVDHGYLRPVQLESDGPDRKPSPMYVPHSDICTQNSQNTQN